MWARVTRASRSPNARAISKHRCARRRYSSALLATIPLPIRPIDDKRPRIGSVCWRRSWVGRAAPTCASAGSRTSVLRWPAMQRRYVARGAHVASPMVGGRLKGSPCLRRAGERHTSGVPPTLPNPRSPRGISEPRSVGARIPCPGRGSRCPSPARDFLASSWGVVAVSLRSHLSATKGFSF